MLIRSVDKYLYYESFSKKRSLPKQLAQHKRATKTKYYEFCRKIFHDLNHFTRFSARNGELYLK